MSKQREALKLALEALIEVTGWQWAGPMRVMDEVEDAISAIREALAEPEKANQCGETCERAKLCAVCANGLAEPEQEPVAWLSEGGDVSRSKRYMDEMGFICEPLYAAPPARKPAGTVTGWYGGHPVIEPIDGWIPAVGTVLYAAPAARKSLTDEQLRKLARDAGIKLMNDEALALGYLPANIKKFARAIERTHEITE